MEYRDIYTAELTRTGRSEPNGYKLQAGEYLYHVHMLMRDTNGQWLLQRRALNARHFPGQWDVTGGGVSAGEEGLDAAVREVREELGLEIDPATVVHAGRETQLWGDDRGNITDIFAAELPIDVAALALDPREVAGARLVPLGEFIETVLYNKTDYYHRTIERANALLDGRVQIDA